METTVEQDNKTREPFLVLFVIIYLIALSPLMGILFDIKPRPMMTFLFSALFVWILCCGFVWIREHLKNREVINKT